MPIQLTPQQQEAIDREGALPHRVIDPRTNGAYVLVPESDYDSVRDLLDEERRQRAIHDIALHNAMGRIRENP